MMNENYEERIRFERVLSQTRRVPVKVLTGFTVESNAPVTVKASGVLIFDDEGNFVEVASPSDAIVYCPYCKGNFPVDPSMIDEVHFCGWCGERLGDE